MYLSDFGKKLAEQSGIQQLMDDLGQPIPAGVKAYQLGGGNPARVPDVEKAYRLETEKLLASGDDFENAIARYDTPQGRVSFIETLSAFFRREYGWDIGPENIAITNGSQSAFFFLFNMFSGTFSQPGKEPIKKTIVFPLVPEYVGYADQGIEKGTFVGIPAKCEYYPDNTYKYFIDFDALESYLETHSEVGAMCVSRPTNPTGNVLTNDEIHHLSALAYKYNIPLFVDNAYGLPFPNIIFTDDAKPYWDSSVILSMSLSKIGLPSLRTGIVVAKAELISALSSVNSIVALASGSLGQVISQDLFATGKMKTLAESFVKPFYQQKSLFAQSCFKEYFAGTNYSVHKSEGAIFNWILMNDLKIPTKELYVKLKDQGVITVPGEYFFFGTPNHPHYNKCLRINYSRPEDEVREGIKIIADTYKKFSK